MARPELIYLCDCQALLKGANYHALKFCRHFSARSASDHLLHSVSSARTFLSDLHLRAQSTLSEAWARVGFSNYLGTKLCKQILMKVQANLHCRMS